MADLVLNPTALAHEHVAKGRRIVARQRQLITEIGARGGDSEQAEDLLAAFERSLAIFEDDLAAIMNKPTPRPECSQDVTPPSRRRI